MQEENLVVKVKKTAKYNSYAGEVTPAVQNEIERDFSAEKPNSKWITDITEFAIPAGKVYLSPIVDCFDGLGCSPDNSACEGVFGRLKNEMFYNTDWTGISISDFIEILNNYLVWYNESRIKKSLGYMSPMEYRRSLGLVA